MMKDDQVGLDITDELLRQLADIRSDGQVLPPPTILVERRHLRGRDVAAVTVMPSDSPPVRYSGRIHVRSGARRAIATPQDERILNEKRRSLDVPFDIRPLRSAKDSDLNQLIFEKEYLPKAFSADVLEANERRLHERMAVTKMITSPDEPTPTVLGILTLGRTPHDFVPGAWL